MVINIMLYLMTAIIAYLIGSISFSVIISKKMAGFDVRTKGSGNAGTTNILRNVGKKAALITLFLDMLKGIVAILIAFAFGKFVGHSTAILIQIAALFVVIGHTYPLYFGFKGGKGVATSLGIILLLNWRIGLTCMLLGIFLIALTRMVSLASVTAAVLFPILTIFMNQGYLAKGNYIIFGLILAAFVMFNHRENIKRIIAGNENQINFKKTGNSENTEETKEEDSE